MKKILFLVVTLTVLLLASCIPSLHPIVDEDTRILDDRLIGNWILTNGVLSKPKIEMTSFSVETNDPNEDLEQIEKEMQSFMDSINNAHIAEKGYWKFERAADITFGYSKLPPGTIKWGAKVFPGTISDLDRYKILMENNDIIIKEKQEKKFYFLTHVHPSEVVDWENQRRIKVTMTKIKGEIYLDFESTKDLIPGGTVYESHITGHTFAKLKIENDQFKIQNFNSDYIAQMLKKNKVRLKHELINRPKVIHDFTNDTKKVIKNEAVIITASTKELRSFIEKYGKDNRLFEKTQLLEQITL